MNQHSKIYVAGHRGLVGGAIVRALESQGFVNIVTRTRAGLIEAWAHPATALIVAHGGIFYVLAGLLKVPVTTAYYGNALPLLFERDGAGWRITPLDTAVAGESNIA